MSNIKCQIMVYGTKKKQYSFIVDLGSTPCKMCRTTSENRVYTYANVTCIGNLTLTTSIPNVCKLKSPIMDKIFHPRLNGGDLTLTGRCWDGVQDTQNV